MAYCSKCGNVVDSKFCASCGTGTRGNPIGAGATPAAGGGNVLRSNFPANQMRMGYRGIIPQRNFLLWFIISVAVTLLSIFGTGFLFSLFGLSGGIFAIFGDTVGYIISGIVYGIYTYYLMIDFTKYLEDMKQKDKELGTTESPFNLTLLLPLLIVIPYGLHSIFLILGNIFNFNLNPATSFSIISFAIISFLYCVPGMIFLYLKHKVMANTSLQALEQEILPTPISVKDPNRPLIIIGILYACLFILLIISAFIFESQLQTASDFFDNDAIDNNEPIPSGVLNAFFIVLILTTLVFSIVIALFSVWLYYEHQWHKSLYQLIKDSYLHGILGDDNISEGAVEGSPPLP